MIVVNQLSTLKLEYFFFQDPIPNTINPGFYSRIVYSTEYYVLNGIYIYLPMLCTHQSVYFKSEKYFYDATNLNNQLRIEKLIKLERDLLKKYARFSLTIGAKHPDYKLQEKIQEGCIKTIRNQDVSLTRLGASNITAFLIKFSGIWESETHYGLTFRIFSLPQV